MNKLFSLLVLFAVVGLARSQNCYDWDNEGHINCVVLGCEENDYSITDLFITGATTLSTCIGTMTNLQTLRVSSGQLTSVPTEIGNLTNLTQLQLQFNQLTSLPTEIGKITSLRALQVQNNLLTSLPTEIGNLTSLRAFRFQFNQLTSLPTEIGKLTDLTNLDYFNNQLTSLPTEIGSLPSLLALQLQFNQLTSLPTEIGNLPSLTNLQLQNNKLISLPTEIGILPSSLQFLQLQNNKLTSLPTEIGKITGLRVLQVQNNQLASLPTEIGNLASLQFFLYNDNPYNCPVDTTPSNSNAYNNAITDINSNCNSQCSDGKCNSFSQCQLLKNWDGSQCVSISCPADSGFPETLVGQSTSLTNCPVGKFGTSSRNCNSPNLWGPIIDNCEECPFGSTSNAGTELVEGCTEFCDSNPCNIPFSFCENGPSSHICNCLPGYDGFDGDGDGKIECTPNTRTTSLSSLQPIARFLFDGTNEDSTGTGNIAILTPGITRSLFYQRGNQENEALRLNGNDLITIPLTMDSRFTVEILFNVQQLTPLYDLFTILPTPTSRRNQAKLIIAGDANRKLQWFRSNLVRIGISRNIIRVGITHSLVSTVRGGKVVTFLDNIKLGTFDLTLTGGSNTLVIGNNFNGYIDEINVFNVGIFDPPGNIINDLTQCNKPCPIGQVCANNPSASTCVPA